MNPHWFHARFGVILAACAISGSVLPGCSETGDEHGALAGGRADGGSEGEVSSVLDPATMGRVEIVSALEGRAIESLRDVVAAGFEAMRFHDPQPAPVDVVLIRTAETDFGPIADVADLGWGELARHVEVVEIPTAHLEVFRGGSMDLARVVRAVVERNRQR